MLGKKIYLMLIVVCPFILYGTFAFSQDSTSTSTPSSKEESKVTEVQPNDNTSSSQSSVDVEKKEVEQKEPATTVQDNSSENKDKDSVKKEEATSPSTKELTDQKQEPKQEQKQDQKAKEQQPSLVQTPEEATLPKKDIEQLVSDNVSVQLDLGLATNIKISSDSLLRSTLSGISLFVKLKNFSQDLALMINSRYSAVIAETGSNQTKFNAKIENISVGSSVKYKLNKRFSALAGLDLGVSYGKKYFLSDSDSSFVKFSCSYLALKVSNPTSGVSFNS